MYETHSESSPTLVPFPDPGNPFLPHPVVTAIHIYLSVIETIVGRTGEDWGPLTPDQSAPTISRGNVSVLDKTR